MSSNRHRAVPVTAVLLAVGLWTGHASAAAAPEPGAPEVPAAERSEAAGPSGDAANPAVQCYVAARGDTTRGGSDDAATYACDLAVRIARDAAAAGGGNAAVIAALANRALVLARTGRLEPALTDLDAALTMAPDDSRLYGNRGNLLLRLGRLEEALAAHDRAVALAPRNPEVYYNRAFVYRALGEPALAAEDVARARQLLPVRDRDTREPASGRGR